MLLITLFRSLIVFVAMLCLSFTTAITPTQADPLFPNWDSNAATYIAYGDYDLKRALEWKSCRRCDLSGADLHGADLNRIRLGGANLRDANLSNANLSEADLDQANLSSANLSYEDTVYNSDLDFEPL